MSWSSRIPELIGALEGAADAGLEPGIAVLADAVRDALRGGYTSGDYVTGANINSVIRPAPFTEGGVRTRLVTTRLTDPPYPWFWEAGFFSGTIGLAGAPDASSVGTRQQGHFIRVEKWRPAAEQSADAVGAAFAQGVTTYLQAHLGGAG